eukprot:767821-Hanusia_phi.AAC.12
MEMYIMGKCPWCAKAMEKIADSINCDYTCSYQGQELTARLDFNVHMSGQMVEMIVLRCGEGEEEEAADFEAAGQEGYNGKDN